MPAALPETLKAFVQRQDAATLCAVLLELAETHVAVKQRLVRLALMDRPDKLAAGFKKTLAALRASSQAHGDRESSEYGRMLGAWLDQVAHELAPKDPAAAVALFEAFIELDSTWFDDGDDSNGCINDAVGAACRHWLQAAALCEGPADEWTERLIRLHRADQYGARDELLRCADLLLNAESLQTLVAQFESQMAIALAVVAKAKGHSAELSNMLSALSLLSEAIRDPDVNVRAVLCCSPDPSPLQRQSFAQGYLQADRAADALPWLQGTWGHWEEIREGLLADALEQLGCLADSLPIRRQLFERSPTALYLQRWIEHLPQADRAAAQVHARQVAMAHADVDVVMAVTVLFELGDADTAEALLVAEPTRIDGRHYVSLVPLAVAFRTHERWLGEAIVYRALLRGVLERGYAPAYGHGASYLARLRELAYAGVGVTHMQSHDAFEAEIKLVHRRKSAFWAHVNGKREALLEDGDDFDG